MKVYCAWHKKYFPKECDTKGDYYVRDKAPFAKEIRTDGMCPRCKKLQMKEVEDYLKGGDRQ